MAKAPFQTHHVLPQNLFDNNTLLIELEAKGLLARNAQSNLLQVPSTDDLARELDYGPHRGPHGAYSSGVSKYLSDLTTSKDGQAALAGDKAAQARIVKKIDGFQDALKVAISQGDLEIARPAGADLDAMKVRIGQFFDGIDGYARSHAADISKMGRLTGPEAKWAAVLQSPQKAEAI